MAPRAKLSTRLARDRLEAPCFETVDDAPFNAAAPLLRTQERPRCAGCIWRSVTPCGRHDSSSSGKLYRRLQPSHFPLRRPTRSVLVRRLGGGRCRRPASSPWRPLPSRALRRHAQTPVAESETLSVHGAPVQETKKIYDLRKSFRIRLLPNINLQLPTRDATEPLMLRRKARRPLRSPGAPTTTATTAGGANCQQSPGRHSHLHKLPTSHRSWNRRRARRNETN